MTSEGSRKWLSRSGDFGIARNRKRASHLLECPFLNLMSTIVVDSSRGGTRTPDPVINSHLLYHLSYSGIAMKISHSDDRNQPTRVPSSARVTPLQSSVRYLPHMRAK